jgi:hypothetical protein
MSLCEHFRPGTYPFGVDLEIDGHLGFTEALVHCRHCRAPYLLELLDWQGGLRLFRVSEPAPEAAAALLKDLARGSCDLSRAGAEVQQFSLAARRLPELLLIEMSERSIVARYRVENPRLVPGTGWRDLPCDGSWIERIQSARL